MCAGFLLTILYSPILIVTGNGGERRRNDSPEVLENWELMGDSEQQWNALVVPVEGVEPPCLAAIDFESIASAIPPHGPAVSISSAAVMRKTKIAGDTHRLHPAGLASTPMIGHLGGNED